MTNTEPGIASSARRTPPPPPPEHLRIAVTIAFVLAAGGISSLVLWGRLKQANLWPGWLAFSFVVLSAWALVGRRVSAALKPSTLEPTLRLLTIVLTGAAAFLMFWLAVAELGVGIGMDMGSALRSSMVVCVVVAVIVAALALTRRLPDSLSTILSVELALLFFGVITNGLISMGLMLLKPYVANDSSTIRFASAAVAIGVVYVLTSRDFFVEQTRHTLRFGAAWLPAVIGSVFAASVALHLLLAVELRTSAARDRVLLYVDNGVALVFVFMMLWLLIFGRRWRVASWSCMALAAAASIFLVGETRADRRAIVRVSEQARRASHSLRSQDYDDSLRRWREVLEVREQALPGAHRLVFEALAGKGYALLGLGESEEAIDLMSRALVMGEELPDASDLEISTLRAKLVVSLQQLGRLDEANSLLASLDLSEILELPTGDSELGPMLTSVADALRISGRFDDAEQLYRRAIVAVDEAKRRDYDAVFQANSGLVRVLSATGRYEEARTIVQDLQSLMRHKYRVLQMSVCYQLEAEIDASVERYQSAVRLQEQALSLRAKELGEDHPDIGAMLRDLGSYLIGAGDLQGARAASTAARGILLESLGPDSPEIVKADYALARVYIAGMRYEKAIAILESCLDRWREIYGDDYFRIPEARHLLASLLAWKGDHSAASDLYAESQENALEHFKSSLATLSDQQQLAALRRLQQRSAEFMIHTADHQADDPAVVARCFDGWLQIKGLLLEIQRARGEMLSRSPSERAAEVGKRFRVIENRLASLWFEGRRARDSNDEVSKLQKEKADLEKELNELLAESGFWMSNEVVTSHTLGERLSPGTAYIDYCWARSGIGPDRYLAFVLLAGGGSEPRLVDLGLARDVERSVGEYFAVVSFGVEKHPNANPVSRRLYDTVIRPVLPTDPYIQNLLVSPDGILARLPLSAVIEPSGGFLEDRYRISYLSSGRDVALWDKPYRRKRSAIIFADPDYDMVPPKIHDEEDEATKSRRSRRRSYRAPPMAGVRLQRLPGTLLEADGIARLLEDKSSLDVLLFTELSASEEAMAFIESPWLMHLATHGYFFPPKQRTVPEDVPASMAILGLGGFQANPDDNPLARAGLALAGANPAIRNGDEYGLLTLDEIMAMPLVDTEMVVVSSCESGLGEIRQGEGVFGVGRAFLAAGSRSVVVTLWSVADGPTAELMQNFYARWLAGESKAEALRQARTSLRRKYPQVAIWAPFVLVGDPS